MSGISADNKKTAKTAILNVLANVLALVVGLLIMPILTRVLSQEDIGIAATFIANRNVIVIVITLAIYAYVNRALIEFSNDKKRYLLSISTFCLFSIGISLLVSLPFKNAIQTLLALDDFLFYWLFASMLAEALYLIADYFCIFQTFTKTVFTITLLTGSLAPVLSVILSYYLSTNKYIGRVLGLDAPFVLIAIVLIAWLLFASPRVSPKLQYVKTSLRYTIPLIPHVLSQTVLAQCDLIMITSMLDAADTGIYSMGHSIGFLAFTILTQIMAVWSPWVYRRLNEGDSNSIRSASKLLILFGFYLTVCLLCIAPEVIKLLLPGDYYITNYVIPPLAASMFMQFNYMFIYDIEYFNKKMKRIAFASFAGAGINVALNFVFIPIVGFYAACYTTLFSYTLIFVLNILFAWNLGIRRTFDLKYMFTMILCMLAFMFVFVCSVDNPIVRYAILVLMSAVLIVRKRHDLMTFARSLLKSQN